MALPDLVLKGALGSGSRPRRQVGILSFKFSTQISASELRAS